jgi:hypothetical protein
MAESFSCRLDVLHGGLGMDTDPHRNQCGSKSLDSHLVRLPIPICEAPMQIRIKAPNGVVGLQHLAIMTNGDWGLSADGNSYRAEDSC